ncbi:hypothetical protein RCG23_01325 [Neobacillus sp. PS3-34]|uniref:hypothetical protein n=1 Tax=Neobacillus sp. PS3-34 TaxID=3070678 RepID=UPI0027E0D5DD|nr:hypothetical protein [Neobacillus sp. PS3-34]WML48804.1 hypothetical protein RCG23_01325 [Neobacillus sp. PS3-34]
MSEIALLTVTHDPQGRNIKLFNKLQKDFDDIYSELFITISEESSIELIKEMERSKFNVKIIPKKGVAQARREVLNLGFLGKSQYYHYCDFDRLLTWGKNHLEELKKLVANIRNYDYLILGRTERAMNTHPLEWIETEKITNKICSFELGKEVDITAGSCSFSRESAEFLVRYSKEKMTDAEWAMIVHRIAKLDVGYIPVEGLEYQEETNGISRITSDSEKWLGRLQLSLIISESAMKIGK